MRNHIGRREFTTLLGGAAAWPVAARVQPRGMPVIGYLGARSAAADANLIEAFHQGLGESGFAVGKNVGIEFRWADGQVERLPALATELVRRRVTIIVTAGGPAAPAARAASSTIPIVFSTGSDPVRTGLVASLSRPGGNLTGVTTFARALGAKRLGLLVDLTPNLETVVYLTNLEEPNASDQATEVQEAARGIGRDLRVLSTPTESDIVSGFRLGQPGNSAVLVAASAWLQIRRALIVALATRHGLPTLYPIREWATIGGLISYGTNFNASYHQVGVYAGRILKGAKPSELPVMQPTKFELVINLGTAKALDLTIPPGILAIADEVIE